MDDSAAALALSTSGSVCPDGADAAFFAGLVGKGLVQTALQLAKACVESGQKLDDQEIQKTVNQLRKRLSDLTMFVQASNRESSHVFPAFEWAQSRDSIFISVKFAHKLDTPACIDVAEDKAEMERSSVVVSAVCKGKNKRFTLDLQLLKEIDPSNSTWAMASVGRGMLTLKKAEEKKWPRLLKTRDRVKNMHKWFSLQEKYEQDLKDLENELEKQAAEAESAANGDSMDPASPSANQENDAASSVAASAPPTEKPTEDIERQRQRKAAKKKAKSEKKRLKKQRSKSLKAVDERTKQRKEELDKEAEQEKQTIRDKHEEELKAVDAALQKGMCWTPPSVTSTHMNEFFLVSARSDRYSRGRIGPAVPLRPFVRILLIF